MLPTYCGEKLFSFTDKLDYAWGLCKGASHSLITSASINIDNARTGRVPLSQAVLATGIPGATVVNRGGTKNMTIEVTRAVACP